MDDTSRGQDARSPKNAAGAASPVPKILILSCSAGMGHVRAARALQHAFAARTGEARVAAIDILQYASPPFRWIYKQGYEFCADRLPAVWDRIYRSTNHPQPTGSMLRALYRWNLRPLLDALTSEPWDAVVTTHFLPPELLLPLRQRGALRARLYEVITDFDVHYTWAHAGLDHYFVAAPEIGRLLAERSGAAESRITATGIPIETRPPTAAELALTRENLRLDPARKTVLLTTSGFAHRRIPDTVRFLAAEFPETQCIAVCGRDTALYHHLQLLSESLPDRFICRPVGWTDAMHELMGLSDLIVTKAGGLITSESLAAGLAVIVANAIPGQEEANAEFLVRHGAGRRGQSLPDLQAALRECLTHAATLDTMRERARALGKPNAAADIAAHILRDLKSEIRDR